MDYQSLNSVITQIDKKKVKKASVKKRLHKSINNLQKLDEITWLLDYHAKLPKKNWYPKVQVYQKRTGILKFKYCTKFWVILLVYQ